jgi:hypothetical protein
MFGQRCAPSHSMVICMRPIEIGIRYTAGQG